MTKLIGVYTALFGPYDIPQPPRFDDVDFVLFTDQDVNPKGWQVRRVGRPHPDPRYASRYYFDQSCLVMPDYEYTIMHGANVRLTMSPVKVLEYLSNSADIAAFKHPHRESVYEEARVCAHWRKDSRATIEAQMERYRLAGFPVDFPLSACILLVRRNTERLREFETFWWNEVRNGSCRDQLSFDYCCWQLGVDVDYLPGNPFQSSILKVGKHVRPT
jgi:hypothetical protein